MLRRATSSLISNFSSKFLSPKRFLVKNFKRDAQVATVARYDRYGDPSKVIRLEQETLPNLEPKKVLVQMLFASINPYDLALIERTFKMPSKLPSVPGLEGVGKILEVGEGVHGLAAGDLVVPAKHGFGTWRTHAVCDSDDLIKVENSDGVKPEYLANLSINTCTALRLLEDFVKLKEGDVIIQNAGNGQIGSAISQIANGRGIKTISVIRPRPDHAEVTELLKVYGSYIVVPEDYLPTQDFKRLISDLPKPKLALNAVGGPTVTEMARNLAVGGTLVTYSGVFNKSIQIPTSVLLHNNIKLKGFWLNRWIEENSKEERTKMFNTLIGLMKNKKPGEGLRLWSEVHKFSNLSIALKSHYENYRPRKILLNLQL
eukprot:TRINITY_DN1774_c0_g1_i1.p1 TRINITY_DN1774_c0_g1~~TRINITY_DN1774_c0_g1_i1.p1  ORF type:complete len:373 (+),score=63.04 TRINITY_DN1774_c0_g1_i1:130-1248(+)